VDANRRLAAVDEGLQRSAARKAPITFIPSPTPENEMDEERVVRVRAEEADHFAQPCRREIGVDVQPGVPLDRSTYLKWRAKQSWAPIGRRAR
jgi:hypothetical protein